ncbi:MAG: hypothetical protein WA803_15800 [Steroidobacteraceae bacterium]
MQRDVLGRASAATRGGFAAFIVLGAIPLAARGDWTMGADAAVRHDDNVGNAQFSSDIVADTFYVARLSIFRLFPLDNGYSMSVGGDLDGESYQKLSGLDNVSLDAAIALKKKWGLGAFAPWARAAVSVARSSYDDSYRNAWDYRATLASGRRFDERWNFWADYTYENRAASPQEEEVPGISGDAFSQVSHSLGINLEYSLMQSTYLSVGLLARHGDVVSTSAPNGTVYSASSALAEDPAFGPNAYAYKLTGTTYGFRLGLSFSPTAHSLLGCGFDRFETHAYEGNEYAKSIVEITWNYRY